MNNIFANNTTKISYSVRRDMFKRVTNMLILCNVVAFICSLVINKIDNRHVTACLVLSTVLCICIRVLVNRIKNYRVLSIIFVGYVEFFLLPVFNFADIQMAICTPIWFVGCLIIMMFVLEQRDFWWVFIIVLYWNSFLYTKTFIWDSVSSSIANKSSYFHGYALSFAMISIALNVILLKIEKNYNKAESEIDKSREKERNARLAKSRFLANMSHEIRTPMNSIIGLSELILKDEMDDVIRNEVNIVRKSSYDLLDIIDDVLMYSKLDAKKVKITNVEFRFDELLNQVITNVTRNLDKKDIKIRVKIDHNIPKVVIGDDIRIKQVFMSLAFISLALTENGRLMFSVDCERNEEDETVKFFCKISDTGCGLSQYDLDAIYGAYDTYDSRQNSNLKGIGLKFSICKEILELLGGTMEIKSIDGVGLESEFSFTLKIANAEPMIIVENGESKRVLIYTSDNREYNSWKSIMEGFRIRPYYVNSYFSFDRAIKNKQYDFIFIPDNIYPMVSNIINAYNLDEYTYVTTDSEKSYGDFDKCRIVRHPVSSLSLVNVLNNLWKEEDYIVKTEEIQIDGRLAKILVVDDNAVNLKVAQGIFLSYNIAIDTARSGEEALKKIQEKSYHIVFMDMVMPEMSGEETLNRMRHMNVNNAKEVPVVALTANTGGNIKQEILDKGFQEYIAKPIKQRYITQCLIKMLPPDVLKNKAPQKADTMIASTSAINKQIIEEPKPVIVDFEKGKSNLGGSEEVYKNVLVTFVKECTDKLTRLDSMFEDKDYSLFTTTVHGIKSSLASIGAETASKRFFDLEKAGKISDEAFIGSHLKDAENALSEVINCVNEYIGVATSDNSEEVFDEKTIERLKTAINDFDISFIRSFFEEAEYIKDGSKAKKTVKDMSEAFEMFDFKKLSILADAL